jgi:hypothetical protein
MPTILVIWEAEIKSVGVGGQSRQLDQETPISKITKVK